jgi:hypothetical protein
VSAPEIPASILDQIRQLHATRKPLNLTAAKRDSPQLVEAVYRIPGMGWKKALSLAGIDYEDIRIEPIPSCVCQLCGQRFHELSLHLKKSHGWRIAQYRQQYPNAPRRIYSTMPTSASSLMGHWEREWTGEYVVDRILEFEQRHFPLWASRIKLHEPNFWRQAQRCFGSWKKALERAGVKLDSRPPVRQAQKKQQWSKERVIERIKEWQAQGKELNAGVLRRFTLLLPMESMRNWLGLFRSQ